MNPEHPILSAARSALLLASSALMSILASTLLSAPPALAQSIDVPTIAVVRGDTAEIPLSFNAGGGATNFDFVLAYDPSVVDESGLGVVCTPDAVGLSTLACHIDLARDEVRGIGVNFPLSPLSSGVFATITLPVFTDAPAGESASAFAANFAAGSAVDAVDITWTPKVNESYCNATLVGGLVTSPNAMFEACEVLVLGPDFAAQPGASILLSSGLHIDFMPGASVGLGATVSSATCGQSLCETSSEPMPQGCHSCVVQICDVDPSCCDTAFSQACVDRVNTVCGLVCE